nr:hypothetical protein [Natrialba asiatica]
MTGNALPDDSILSLCQDKHRRIVLAMIAHEKRSLTLNDLTKTVLKYNHHTPITEVPEDVLVEIRRSLYHIHLPKLSAAGLITYDQERQFVEPTEQFDQVQPTLSKILDVDPELETPIKL